jgi:hypothetical protein
MKNSMTSPDPTPKELERRLVLQRIAALESEKEQLTARLADIDDMDTPGFRDQVIALGALMFQIHQLRRQEKRFRGEPV